MVLNFVLLILFCDCKRSLKLKNSLGVSIAVRFQAAGAAKPEQTGSPILDNKVDLKFLKQFGCVDSGEVSSCRSSEARTDRKSNPA